MSERRTDIKHHSGFDLAVEEAEPKVKRPPLYRVVLINDDFTPMEFVVDILESVFSMERTRAWSRMLVWTSARTFDVCCTLSKVALMSAMYLLVVSNAACGASGLSLVSIK